MVGAYSDEVTEEAIMKRSLLVLTITALAFGTWGLLAPATPVKTAPLDETITIEAIIGQLEQGWAMAIVSKDTIALDRLLAKDFNGTSAKGEPYSREMAIEDIKNGVFVVDSMDFDDITVKVFGDMAIAFTSEDEISRHYDVDQSGHYHTTDVWVKRDGRWQVVASHSSRSE
jgi:ketosteroid isomerase-like protein